MLWAAVATENILHWPRILPEFFADDSYNTIFRANQHLVYDNMMDKQHVVLSRIMAMNQKIR
ncbi:MAG TPA: hypothetical protein DHV03_03270 [Alphaproteobacteria bacterium]|nr:MAG: hypothetical protein DBW67_00050 [SAR116 cluster bacterium]HCJ62601.1 hypothetical protein [Alphaproteobacteria bacterium]HCY47680.1 hypothetical protein [Alphaproteobacteria bacterium]